MAVKVNSVDDSSLYIFRNDTFCSNFFVVLEVRIRHSGELNSSPMRIFGLGPLFIDDPFVSTVPGIGVVRAVRGAGAILGLETRLPSIVAAIYQ